jgi:6-pyruvoyltetrahydropterin/6-carboxytetrahydropterin synthase
MIYTSTKFYKELGPCAYRNWNSDTDCYLLHGYCRSFKFVFGCKNLDKQGFVVDFGGLKDFKRWLEDKFDHTVILQADDPMVHVFRKLEEKGHLKLNTFPLVSSEGLAEYVGECLDSILQRKYDGRCWVISSEHIEASKNGSFYYPQENPDRLSFYEIEEFTQEIEKQSDKIELDML